MLFLGQTTCFSRRLQSSDCLEADLRWQAELFLWCRVPDSQAKYGDLHVG